MKDVDLGRVDIISRPCLLGCTQRACQISRNIENNYRNMFESKISAGAMENYRFSEKIGCKYFLMILCHRRSCKEVRGKILRTDKQNNSLVIQSRNSMH